MRYALISDVHANLPALEAVMRDIAGRAGPSLRSGQALATYHLGDLVGYAPWPDETVELLRRARVPGVAGNYDSTVATDYAHCGCRYEDPRQEELSHLSYAWTRAHVSPETKAFLGSLPFRIDLRPLGGHAGGPTITLLHGNQVLNTVYVTEDRPDAFLTKMGAGAGAKPGDVVCFGHTHKPWHRAVEGVHFVNTGSVGRPKDGDWRAGYVLLTFDGGSVDVEIVRVEYDLDATMRGIRASDLPHEFADYLRTGGVLA
ncbi:MAG TPA: metallophosphoesterase family protein [Gemmatimonadaceae bacterium]|nr:metallophosphoesterase family protein [Gemmatimonadaceae bacterium]